MSNILYGLNVVAHLALIAMLVFLCFRTRSKGLILISVILLTGGIFDWVFEQGIDLYVDRWRTREIAGDGVQNMSAGDFLIRVSLIKHLLYECLCLLGGFLVYKEWRQGKFRQPQPEHIEESTS